MFAEAKLGHCNASEEIDNTRFWKWDEHPVPHMAPDIEAIKAGQHLVKDLNLQPTPFPQSMLNIVNPPSAPDPQGMTAALTALATANIFRDMSGRAEVADLLKTLSDNSVAIAGVAQKAATGGGAKTGGGGAAGTASPGAAGSGAANGSSPLGTAGAPQDTSTPQTQPQQPPPQTEEQKRAGVINNAAKTGETAMAYVSPKKRGGIDGIEDKIAKDLKGQSTTEALQFSIEIRSLRGAVGYGRLDKVIIRYKALRSRK